MIVAILQLELSIPGAQSLKDKRCVVKSLKDRLHREHLVAVAEVGALASLSGAVLGVACVGNDSKHLSQTLDHVLEKVRKRTDCELIASERTLATVDALREQRSPIHDDALASEMLARALDEDER